MERHCAPPVTTGSLRWGRLGVPRSRCRALHTTRNTAQVIKSSRRVWRTLSGRSGPSHTLACTAWTAMRGVRRETAWHGASAHHCITPGSLQLPSIMIPTDVDASLCVQAFTPCSPTSVLCVPPSTAAPCHPPCSPRDQPPAASQLQPPSELQQQQLLVVVGPAEGRALADGAGRQAQRHAKEQSRQACEEAPLHHLPAERAAASSDAPAPHSSRQAISENAGGGNGTSAAGQAGGTPPSCSSSSGRPSSTQAAAMHARALTRAIKACGSWEEVRIRMRAP